MGYRKMKEYNESTNRFSDLRQRRPFVRRERVSIASWLRMRDRWDDDDEPPLCPVLAAIPIPGRWNQKETIDAVMRAAA
jgi:hypothetical protein